MDLLFFEKMLLEDGEGNNQNSSQPPTEQQAPQPPPDNTPPPDIPDVPEPPPPPQEYDQQGDNGQEEDYSDYADNDQGGDQQNNGEGGDKKGEPEFSEKISNILNVKLYQRYIQLLSKIENQLITIKNNTDIFTILFKSSGDSIDILKKLDENIRLYIKYYFVKENYSKNLLFFNKCINLFKINNDLLNKSMKHNSSDLE